MGPTHRLVPDAGDLPHVFVADLATMFLEPEDHHHLVHVARHRPGDRVIACDGVGAWRVAVISSDPTVLEPADAGSVHTTAAPEPAIAIAFALVKGSKPDLIIQKLTELGVDRIIPFLAARSVVRPAPDRAPRQHERWVRIAREAAMQSHRVRLPEVEPIQALADLVARPGAVAADFDGDRVSLATPTILIGPEGGWTDDERASFRGAVALGDHVLRAETACIAAGALLTGLRSGTL